MDILKSVWFLAFPRPNGLMAGREKTKSWLQLSPDWKAPRTFPGLKSAEDFTRTKLFLDFSENHFEMSINHLKLSLYLQGRRFYELSYQT